MEVYLPNSAFIGNIDSFIRGIDTSNTDRLDISANPKWVSVHPVVIAMVAALGLQLKPTDISRPNLTARSIHYLERMGLFKHLGIDSGLKIIEHEPAGRFIPLRQIKTPDGLSQFITDLVPLLHLDPNQALPIKYALSELVRNVFEHATSPIGAIATAQYYKKSNSVRIGIVDTGAGIKKTITHAHSARTDLEALRLALTPGITGTTSREGGTEFNAGAGLFFIKSIATVNKGSFMIYSGQAMYKLLKSKTKKLWIDPFKDKHSHVENLPAWHGTVVGVDIPLDNNASFSTLLDLIRDTYTEAVRERRKAKFKRPQFI